MGLTDSIKRAPRWAWLTAAGVTVGAVGIKVWKDRDAEPSEGTEGTEVGSPTYGTPGTSGSPTPVITPPVIIGGDNGDNGGLAQFVATLGGSFDTLVTSLTGLAAGDQQLAGQGMSGITDIATAVIAGAGSAPAPVIQNPTPVIVNVPAPAAPAASIPQGGFGGGAKPCCTYGGKPLSWWRNANNAKRNGKWKWPDGNGFIHSRAFEGNKECDNGGRAPHGTKREC